MLTVDNQLSNVFGESIEDGEVCLFFRLNPSLQFRDAFFSKDLKGLFDNNSKFLLLGLGNLRWYFSVHHKERTVFLHIVDVDGEVRVFVDNFKARYFPQKQLTNRVGRNFFRVPNIQI